LFQSVFAVFTFPAGIHHAANTYQLPDFEIPDLGACFADPADYFMAGNHRIN
jgi:hypothetical protein